MCDLRAGVMVAAAPSIGQLPCPLEGCPSPSGLRQTSYLCKGVAATPWGGRTLPRRPGSLNVYKEPGDTAAGDPEGEAAVSDRTTPTPVCCASRPSFHTWYTSSLSTSLLAQRTHRPPTHSTPLHILSTYTHLPSTYFELLFYMHPSTLIPLLLALPP